jgi:hypothetical protein
MKNTLLFIMLFFVKICLCTGQKIDTVYYTLFYKNASPKRYAIYRVVRNDSGIVKVFDYYKGGSIIMSGGFKSTDFKERTGPFRYYTNSKLKEFRLYEQSKYPEALMPFKVLLEKIPNQSDSLYLVMYFYRNKNIRSAGYRSECCKLVGTWLFFTEDGKSVMLENYKNNIIDGPVYGYDNGFNWLLGQYKEGKRDGDWVYYYVDDHTFYKKVIYKDGKKIKTIR